MVSAKLLRGSARASAAKHCPDDHGVWEVKKTLGSKKGRESRNISGIACTGEGFPRARLVIDDERNSAQFVSVREGELKAGDIVLLSRKKLDGHSLELDGEGGLTLTARSMSSARTDILVTTITSSMQSKSPRA
jgi:hypothetical protein